MTVLEQRAYEAIVKMAHKNEPDYWEKLKHQYAGMAMQALITRIGYNHYTEGDMKEWCVDVATALVEKLKEEK